MKQVLQGPKGLQTGRPGAVPGQWAQPMSRHIWAVAQPGRPHGTGSSPSWPAPTVGSHEHVARRCIAQASTSPSAGVGKHHRLELRAGEGQVIILETGEIGRQAKGAIMATHGETVIYTTACCDDKPTGDGNFVPLTVNYAERFSASGRTSSGFIKRDGRTRDSEVLISRLVDRPLRPLFQKGWANETQVLQWVLSYDDVHLPEPLAITAASAALLVSEIPFQKAVAGVRVGWIDGAPLVNPTVQQMKTSTLDLVLAGTRDAVLMVEGYCQLLTDEQMMQCVTVGSQVVASMCEQMEAWVKGGAGQPKNMRQLVLLPEGLEQRVDGLVSAQLQEVYSRATTKDERSVAEGAAAGRALSTLVKGIVTANDVLVAFKSVQSEAMRRVVLDKGTRLDGRGLTEIRPIRSRANLLPRTHGSCLFTRGETQAIAVATLGGKADALKIDSMRNVAGTEVEEPFYLQYFFPPSSVGETGRVGMPGRRELGHGELAQRALAPVIPTGSDFPYTIRVESTITESNGSSSMATVCGGCLAMLDAGVPLVRPVAGIAMGLILDQATGKWVVLSDILGTEDALGDMDFKVAGDDCGRLTAFQMDIKVEGITLDIMTQALAQARKGREHVLGEMAKCSPAPRQLLSPSAPRVIRIPVAVAQRAAVVGPSGRTVRQIREISGATAINISDEGVLEINAPGEASAQRAQELVDLLLNPPAKGRVFRGACVIGVQAFGVFVNIGPGCEGLVHVSELDTQMLADASSFVKVGESIDVMVLDNTQGKLALSRRSVLLSDSGQPTVPITAASRRAAAAALAAAAGPQGDLMQRSTGGGTNSRR